MRSRPLSVAGPSLATLAYAFFIDSSSRATVHPFPLKEKGGRRSSIFYSKYTAPFSAGTKI